MSSAVTHAAATTADGRPGERWEMGSHFHWQPEAFRRTGEPVVAWLPEGHQLYGHGNAALAGVLDALGSRRTLHLPSYYCMDTSAMLARNADLAWYRELPDAEGPRLESLTAGPGDVVLAQNLFGRGRQGVWEDWMATHPDVVVMEDHTHDPLSGWARRSRAHFCMASLRKTLPLPEGAIAWSPRGLAIEPARSQVDAGSALRLTSMLLKQAWLRGHAVAKGDFWDLHVSGEESLYEADRISPSAVTVAALPLLDVWRLRDVRARNARSLASRLSTLGAPDSAGWRLLDHGGADCVPFGLQIVCGSPAQRDALRTHLRSRHIFPAVHWPQPGRACSSGDPASIAMSSRILTLRVDHRYDEADLARLAEVLLDFPGVDRAA